MTGGEVMGGTVNRKDRVGAPVGKSAETAGPLPCRPAATSKARGQPFSSWLGTTGDLGDLGDLLEIVSCLIGVLLDLL